MSRVKDCVTTSKELHKNENDFEDEDEDEDDNEEGYEEVDDENIQIQSLFNDSVFFDNVKDLFKYELEKNQFNLIKLVKKYKMDMMSYIRMINYIRKNVNFNENIVIIISINFKFNHWLKLNF